MALPVTACHAPRTTWGLPKARCHTLRRAASMLAQITRLVTDRGLCVTCNTKEQPPFAMHACPAQRCQWRTGPRLSTLSRVMRLSMVSLGTLPGVPHPPLTPSAPSPSHAVAKGGRSEALAIRMQRNPKPTASRPATAESPRHRAVTEPRFSSLQHHGVTKPRSATLQHHALTDPPAR